ncbi:hypothetical protein B296_00000510 [Ensete ventricosum]|uniref:Retrotransposon gag domain-containing protein n=1 Tax=Ensete ventricosum TaxID=4639 RepID=A0A427AU80_ENSVE|nr:hypothetical protein B296_00000510 [Ensete ventricosum]
MILPTPNRYWRLFNDPGLAPPDPGLSPITPGLGPPTVTTEAFLGEHPGGAPHPPIEATIENPNASVSQPANRYGDVMRLPPELDVVQRDFVRSKEEVGETTKGGSPFALEILDKPIPSSFRLSTLEPYDGSNDSTKHVAAFRAQMALYDTSDPLMCRTFPTTLRGPAQMWYSQIKPSSISSFDQFAKEFELNFIASSCLRSTAASLLDLTQGNDEPLAQFVSRFSTEIRRMPDTHPTLAIQAFPMGLRPSRFFWSLIERPPSMVLEMLQRASQYVVAESLVAEKREDHKKPRGDKPQGQPFGTPRRRDRSKLPAPRPLPIPLNSTRTEVFLQIQDKGLLRTLNPIRAKIGGRDKRRYCRFHRDYGHDTEECNDLRNQIEDLIRQGHLHWFIRDRQASEE